jgi:hypothetical protein
MPIEVGDCPEGLPNINKFIAICGEGHRGKVIALHKSKKKAIILAMNNSIAEKDEGGVLWGEMYLVEETNPDEYPKVVERVTEVPFSEDWQIV